MPESIRKLPELRWLDLVDNPMFKVPSIEFEEADIWESVFRYQFKNNLGADYYFLSLGAGQDPSPEFMERFKDHDPLVEPVSMSGSNSERSGAIYHKQHGGMGKIFRIDALHWIDGNAVDVEGGYFEAGLSASVNIYRSASVNIYRVERRHRAWVVSKNKIMLRI